MKIVLVLVLCGLALAADVPCYALKKIDGEWSAKFDFTMWKNIKRVFATPNANINPMQNMWSYNFSFCSSISLSMGDALSVAQTDLFGFNYGTLGSIEILPVDHDGPHQHGPVKEFIQHYSNGDTGSPCFAPRTSQVHVWCGVAATNCSGIPGSQADATCYSNGKMDTDYCICGVTFNQTRGVCNGLEIHIVSNKCPDSTAVATPPSSIPWSPHRPTPQANTGVIIFFSILIVILVTFSAVWVYNSQALGKQGLHAMPFYDMVTGGGGASRSSPTYSSVNTSDAEIGSFPVASKKSDYGSL